MSKFLISLFVIKVLTCPTAELTCKGEKMLKVLYARLKQKFRTIPFPKKEPQLPKRFRGLIKIDKSKCTNCKKCEKICPTCAISNNTVDLGKCLFCTKCTTSCPANAISFTCDYRLAVSKRENLLYQDELKLATALNKEMLRIFGRSLKLRQVCAGGCNGCELDINVLTTIVFDLSRFGIKFVASPRHADGILVTGPITQNMNLALKKTYDAVAGPKIVIATGACAISGGPYIGHKEVSKGLDSILPVDLYIPGCPPHPITILDGLLRLLKRR